MARSWLLAVLVGGLLLLTACPGYQPHYDADGDGVEDIDDCAPEDETIYPGAEDVYGDGVDSDCDDCETGVENAGDGVDRDCDGYPANEDLDEQYVDLYDCNDNDASIHPGAVDEPNNGLDEDCDGEECVDLDGDLACSGVDDCNDEDPDVFLGNPEVPDGKDNNCNDDIDEGTDLLDDDGDGACEGFDLDADGFPECSDGSQPGDCDDGNALQNIDDADGDGWSTCLGDCDDANASRFPSNPEVCDGFDNDCDLVLPLSEQDQDLDGYWPCAGDCDDLDPTVRYGAPELPDGIDNDCDGIADEGTELFDDDGDGACEGFDLDADGLPECSDGNEPGDCDDGNALLNIDDADGDGWSTCLGDCDDANASRFPSNPEVCDGFDNDCDLVLPLSEQDQDSDGYWPCAGDCDDLDPALNPVDGDGDSYSPCGGDCDDSDVTLSPADHDADGYSTCAGDCDDYAAILNLDDADGDGWSSCGGDCGDFDTTVFPGAPDVCDAVADNDCDGLTDPLEADDDGDGASECQGDCDDVDSAMNLLDSDGDGWDTCVGDCDDTDAAVFPGAPEICNGVDDDCDGVASDEADVDGDGYSICGGDCDDGDPGPCQAVNLTTGYTHTCALLDTGAVRCWGSGGNGQLGYGNTDDIGDDEFPASAGDVPIGGSAVQVAAGDTHTCALLDTGAVRCWGGGLSHPLILHWERAVQRTAHADAPSGRTRP